MDREIPGKNIELPQTGLSFTDSHLPDKDENMTDRKKILLVSSAFYPEISPRSFRATELAKEFCRKGHDVTVISKFREYDYTDIIKEFRMDFRMWSKPGFPLIPVFRSRPLSYLSRGLSRLLSVLFEYPGIEEMFQVKRMLRKESGYDILISFAVPFPVQWGVAGVWSPEKPIAAKWVADCGDSYMLGRLDTFRKPFYFKFFEKSFCRKCTYITIPFRELQLQFYPEFRSKIKVIPQGFNFKDIILYKGKINNEKPHFIFAGSVIQGKRDLTLFLEFLSSLQFEFLFIVYTNQPDSFMRFKTSLGHKLDVRNYIERLSLIYEMSKADFLVNVDTAFDTISNIEAIPSKLIDYALSERPILNLNSTKLDSEIVMEFLNKNYTRRRIIEKANYDIEKVASGFIEICNETDR